MKQEFKNNPRFSVETNQKLRKKMAEAREQMQKLTAGIYPVTQPKEKQQKNDQS